MFLSLLGVRVSVDLCLMTSDLMQIVALSVQGWVLFLTSTVPFSSGPIWTGIGRIVCIGRPMVDRAQAMSLPPFTSAAEEASGGDPLG